MNILDDDTEWGWWPKKKGCKADNFHVEVSTWLASKPTIRRRIPRVFNVAVSLKNSRGMGTTSASCGATSHSSPLSSPHGISLPVNPSSPTDYYTVSAHF